MPRYELVEGTSNKFWDIKLEGKTCTTTWGRIGASGQNLKTRSYDTPAAAQKDYDRLIREKTTEGYLLVGGKAKGKAAKPAAPAAPAVEPRNAKLEKLIQADPDDDGNFEVYGDWLTTQGHVRGELVTMHAKGMTKPAAKLLASRPELWGDAAGFDDMITDVTWRLGFIDKAKVKFVPDRPGGDGRGGSDAAKVVDVLGWLLDGPGRFMRELTVGLVDYEGNKYDAITRLLAKRGPLPTLRSLFFGDFSYVETELNWSTIGYLEPLYAAVPNLERLKLRSHDMGLGKIVLPKLRKFTTICGGMSAHALQSIAAATWPKLETLDLMIGDRGDKPFPKVKDLQPILDAKGLAKLKWLGIKNFSFHKELVPALLASKIVKQLETLDLSMGTLADGEAEILGAAKAQLGHLKQLIVASNYLTAKGIKALKGLGIPIVTIGDRLGRSSVDKLGQREMDDVDEDDPDSGERYAAVYE